VQTLTSLQLTVPPTQMPLAQVSALVQALLSLQFPTIGLCLQPVNAAQTSAVQTLLSSQLTAAPLQTPAAQTSADVHKVASLQGTLLLTWPQPTA